MAATTPATATSLAWAGPFVIGQPGALALDSAAALWGWCEPPPDVVVLTDHRRRPRPPDGVRLLRTRLIPQGWSRREGLLLTDRARTLADCLRFLPRSQAQEVLDRSQLRDGPGLAQVAAILRRAGVRGWQVNVRLQLRKMTVVVDFLFPDLGLVLEVDGYAYHSKRDQFEHDRRRQNALFNAGTRCCDSPTARSSTSRTRSSPTSSTP